MFSIKVIASGAGRQWEALGGDRRLWEVIRDCSRGQRAAGGEGMQWELHEMLWEAVEKITKDAGIHNNTRVVIQQSLNGDLDGLYYMHPFTWASFLRAVNPPQVFFVRQRVSPPHPSVRTSLQDSLIPALLYTPGSLRAPAEPTGPRGRGWGVGKKDTVVNLFFL